MSFLWDAYQSSQINQLNSRIDRLQDAGAREQAALQVASELEAKIDRLALIWGDMRARNVTDCPSSPANYLDLKRQNSSFEDIAAVTPWTYLPRLNFSAVLPSPNRS